MGLRTISSIVPSEPSSWANTPFLTFDIDWAHDQVIADCVDLVERAEAMATWFATHATPLLERLRHNPLFEIGIHPNFVPLLNGSRQAGSNVAEVISQLKAIVPEATSARSHSLVHSTQILHGFTQCGITHDVNCLVPESAGITLSPWALWDGLIRVPYFWEDDVACLFGDTDMAHTENLSVLRHRPGIKVFNFHPIHVFLNTEHLDRYERTRHLHQNPAELIKHRYTGYGTRNRLVELLTNY